MLNEQDVINSINGNTNYLDKTEDRQSADSDNNDKPSRAGEALAFILETAKIIIISLAIIIPIRYYLVQPFFVKGASMEQNFHDGDYLLIDEISYRFGEPERGDVIVFRYPENPSQFFIKRIIGLPGESVEIKDNTVKIYNSENPEGFLLQEDYLSKGQQTAGNMKIKTGEMEYFVLGDNRLQSSDSRRWGVLNYSFITGKAFIRLYPFNKITKISGVNY